MGAVLSSGASSKGRITERDGTALTLNSLSERKPVNKPVRNNAPFCVVRRLVKRRIHGTVIALNASTAIVPYRTLLPRFFKYIYIVVDFL
jgi:hypothetical protein